jgi:outer membrane lipoprotein-sorting protein
MKKTVIIITAVALLLSGVQSGAKSRTLGAFIEKVNSSLVSFDYSFSMQTPASKSKMTGKGKVKIQGSSFFLEGNGLEVWCDGTTRWTIDRFSEEALVESVEESSDGFATNPALMISAVDEAFDEVSFGTAKFAGKTVDASSLTPVLKGKSSMDIAGLKLFFKSGTTELVGAEIKLNDGSVSEFSISGLSFSAKGQEKGSFRFDEKTLGNSYVVTDLR